MRNNFTFRSRTETYFTHLSAQPLMILIAQTSLYLWFDEVESKNKGNRSSFHQVCAYIFLYTDVFFRINYRLIMRHKIMAQNHGTKSCSNLRKTFAETLRFSDSDSFFIECRKVIDLFIYFSKKHENVNNFAKK